MASVDESIRTGGRRASVKRRAGTDGVVSDKRKTFIRPLSYTCLRPPVARRDHEGWDSMPALRQIGFDEARKIANEKGLFPSKVKGTSTLRFTKGSVLVPFTLLGKRPF